MQVRFKKLDPKAVIPSYAKPGDAGLDLVATSKEFDVEKEKLVFGTGLAIEIPEGHVGLLFPRSSIVKTLLTMANSVGVIDSGYRGEVKVVFDPGSRPKKNYEVGDRVAQLIIMPFPKVEPVEAVDLSDTDRGSGGFGSTGA
jgi:dUTP pyrophosphatase